jgi:hypothetical protein
VGEVGTEEDSLGEFCPTVVAVEKVASGSWSRSLEEKWEVFMWSSWCTYSRRRESPIFGEPFTSFCFVGEGGPK